MSTRHFQRITTVGIGSTTGEPSDAIVLIRERLGQSFREHVPIWSPDLADAIEPLKGIFVRFDAETGEHFEERLRKRVLSSNPRALPREYVEQVYCSFDRGTRRAILHLYRSS
ncbi:hypothetical protein PUN4_550251 [Paraburkholderia unamae]|uniref:hypothetical protein n=1 Tax=Paraburkholderia unamae TaxID=219649 RepID=UPI001CB42E05|nr:hypothetical protein [Paraburkholderia unamae]CAG9268338.1 hypothetical protein PUN4_550251 [Paraburkholderia unamae]